MDKVTAVLDRRQLMCSVVMLMIAGFIFLMPGNGLAKTASAVKMIPNNFSSLFEQASPSVVNIQTEKTVGGGKVYRHYSRNPFGNNDQMEDFFNRFFGGIPQRERIQKSLGTGFVVDEDGYIVTNNHVVENADKIKVILNDKSEYEAEVIGRDDNTDLALIKIDAKEKLKALDLGDSDNLKVGEWVVAIGNPFGLNHTITSGIVSAKGRVIGSGPYDDFIQTDTSINPGNSGGPLIALDGKVVGINTAIVQGGQGIGFAIPANLAKGIIQQLKENGNVTRGWLGVSIQDVTDEFADYYGLEKAEGVVIMNVFPGDPADEAGLRAKDVILEIDGEKIENTRALTNKIANSPVGSKIKVKILRDNKTKTIKVTLTRRQGDPGQDDGKSLGMGLKELSPEISEKYKLNDDSGVVVASIEPGATAHNAGIKPGDIIEEINRKPVTSLKDYYSIMADIDTGEIVTMVIKRRYQGFVIVKLKK